MIKRIAAFLSCILILPALAAPVAVNQNLTIAVAANFASTLRAIITKFNLKTKAQVKISIGSTGSLYARIKNGAPYDIFFSADTKRPVLLEKEGETIKGSRFTYAVGKLALWSVKGLKVNKESLQSKNIGRIAIANPALAPYGLAAEQTLKNLKLWKKLTPQLVYGTNVAQAFTFASTANAQFGFVAFSQILQYKKLHQPNMTRESYWIIPRGDYRPINQQAVLLLSAKNKPIAKQFFSFLKSNLVQGLIKKSGYYIPRNE